MRGLDHPNIQWQRVSGKYATLSAVYFLIPTILLVAATVATAVLAGGWWWLIPAVPAAILGSQIFFAVRRSKAIGYALREDDLVFRKGLMWSRMVAVPYGRLQMVEITRGPIERMLGLATLSSVTAAESTNIAIPGLPPEEAEGLRDHLIRVAETRRVGL